jgi:hypothetical protein
MITFIDDFNEQDEITLFCHNLFQAKMFYLARKHEKLWRIFIGGGGLFETSKLGESPLGKSVC